MNVDTTLTRLLDHVPQTSTAYHPHLYKYWNRPKGNAWADHRSPTQGLILYGLGAESVSPRWCFSVDHVILTRCEEDD